MMLTDCIMVTSVSGFKVMVLSVVKRVDLLLLGGNGSREDVLLYGRK
jgi:hypothetical protein